MFDAGRRSSLRANRMESNQIGFLLARKPHRKVTVVVKDKCEGGGQCPDRDQHWDQRVAQNRLRRFEV